MIAGFDLPDEGQGRNPSELTNLVGCGNPNGGALPYLDPAIAANRAILPPPDTLRRLETLRGADRTPRHEL